MRWAFSGSVLGVRCSVFGLQFFGFRFSTLFRVLQHFITPNSAFAFPDFGLAVL